MSHHFGAQYVDKLLSSSSEVTVPTSVSPLTSPMTSSNFLLKKQQHYQHISINCSTSINSYIRAKRTKSLIPASFSNSIIPQEGIEHSLRPTHTTPDLTLNPISTDVHHACKVTEEKNSNDNHNKDFSHSNIAYKHRLDLLLPRSPLPSTLTPIQNEYSTSICSTISNPDFSLSSSSVSDNDDNLISNPILLQKQ